MTASTSHSNQNRTVPTSQNIRKALGKITPILDSSDNPRMQLQVLLLLIEAVRTARDESLNNASLPSKMNVWDSSYKDLDSEEVDYCWQLTGLVDDATESFQYSRQCLIAAENSKSRLLIGFLRHDSKVEAPLTIPESLRQAESEDLARIIASEKYQLAIMTPKNRSALQASETAPLQLNYSNTRIQLDRTWTQMETFGAEAKTYVESRRDPLLTEKRLARIVQDLPPGTGLLSLFQSDDGLIASLARSDSMRTQTWKCWVSADELKYRFLGNFIDEIYHRQQFLAIGREAIERWRRLGQQLLEPVIDHLEELSHLVIAPHKQLHGLPIHALILDTYDRTLIDHCSVSYLPSLGLLDTHGRGNSKSKSVFVFGHTDADPSTNAGEKEIEYFHEEATMVAGVFSGQAFLAEEATSKRLVENTKTPCRVLHLSCHGVFDGSDPLASHVLLADGPFTARDWMMNSITADIVTLSACQTARSGSLGGDELVGLSQAILYAGASSLLLSLWNVVSYTTMKMMVDFYQRLNGPDAPGKAEALRQTMLAMRSGALTPELAELTGFDSADPYYWAPFVLIGEWRNPDDR